MMTIPLLYSSTNNVRDRNLHGQAKCLIQYGNDSYGLIGFRNCPDKSRKTNMTQGKPRRASRYYSFI